MLLIFFLLLNSLISFINNLLFPLDILKQLAAFNWYSYVVWEDLAILLVELKDSWQSISSFVTPIISLKILTEVIKDEIIFKNRDNMLRFIVHDVARYLCLVILLTVKVFLY